MEPRPIHIQAENLPTTPGVYLIYNEHNDVIYVGKAKNLKNRVKSHLTTSDFSKSRVIRETGHHLEYITTTNENEALLLEYNLIQKHKPPLNSRYMDGKTYPYLRVTMSETYPRFIITRDAHDNEHDIYLGPYSNVKALRKTLRFLFKHFPVADCKHEINPNHHNPWAKTCLRRRTNACLAPCLNPVSIEEYLDQVHAIIHYLQGNMDKLIVSLEQKMWNAAKQQEYEQAAKYRDIIDSIKRTMQSQTVQLPEPITIQVINYAILEDGILLVALKIKDGRVIKKDNDFRERKNHELEDVLASFILDLNLTATSILVPIKIKLRVLRPLLPNTITIKKPSTKVEKQLLELAYRNAISIAKRRTILLHSHEQGDKTKDLQFLLNIEQPIHTIDCFDVSTLQGTANVGSCVRFYNEKPMKKYYRRFKIRSIKTQDDFRMMKELINRRYKTETDLPDLIVIDGGQIQLKFAIQALNEKSFTKKPIIIGLAKKREEIHLPTGKILQYSQDRPGILLLRAIRDEAHRFAITYNRLLRRKQLFAQLGEELLSQQDFSKLKEYFPNLEALASSSVPKLVNLLGINKRLASTLISKSRSYLSLQSLSE